MSTDLGATVHAGMVVMGDRLGFYKALAVGPLAAAELAAITRTDERYVREWLASQAAGGYITYNPQTHKFGMTEEQALTLAFLRPLPEEIIFCPTLQVLPAVFAIESEAQINAAVRRKSPPRSKRRKS